MERLDKIIAASSERSRREVKQLVREGRVFVNGMIARSAEEKVEAETAEIVIDGAPLRFRRFVYLMLNKPAGVQSATEDGHGCTVLDLLPEAYRKRGVFPVGRLDKDTEGLLLLTDDGALAHELLSPKKHVDKVYYARLDGTLTQADCDAFAAGLTLGVGLRCLPAGLTILSAGRESEALITLREGKFHQVKRMAAARGKPVLYLKRVRMGPLELDEKLPSGAWRELTEEECSALHRSYNG